MTYSDISPVQEQSASEGVSKSIVIIGPIAGKNIPAPGGFEAANRRLSDLQERLGFNVFECAYSGGETHGSLSKLSVYHRSFRKIKNDATQCSTNTLCHITPLYKQFLLWEYMLVKRLKRNDNKVIIDLRAGRLVKDYEKFGPLYQHLFRKFMDLADAISVEGERFIPFLQEMRPDLTIHHLPNFILDNEIPSTVPPKPNDIIRFVYVGAVNDAKGVKHGAQLVKALHEKGIKVQFDVFGRVSSDFKNEVSEILNAPEILKFHGPQPYPKIQAALSKAHFFVFLSHWYGEGHSNALTEAMSQGCIPIVTNHGFSEQIAGDASFVVEDRDNLGQTIDSIKSLLSSSGDMQTWHQKNLDSVKDNFSERAISEILNSLYRLT
ncbi:glycosyl transferase family 1 [Yoonia maritima]|uniref:Glycosyl transferase family 1 n=1 Tax=Yoonia maritima TaxID=1435347 RepID=A0A2T0W0Z9_9RHOB|nr:glycosyltransferase family 4 protein [Yoonia maritima]PRY78682.1 glycosyl transferase family 1 [Yoonia maritima]